MDHPCLFLPGSFLPALRRGTALSGFHLFKSRVPICLLGLICACSFYQPSLTLGVHLPPPPDHWQAAFPRLGYRIVYPSRERGGFEERMVDGRAPIQVELPKICFLPVLAFPNPATESVELPPAGGIYPLDCSTSDRSIVLSWERGAAAEALRRLWSQGVDCSALNVERLTREMAERCRGDPWELDLERICAGLAAGDFHLTDIRLSPSRDLPIEPGPGHWFLESPFRRPVAAGPDGLLLLEAVSLGAHLLFDRDSGTCLFLYVGEEVLFAPQ